jgi:N-acetylglucosamine-6-sulfatase
MLASSSPHVQNEKYECIPLARHADDFPNVTAPRNPNWNPADEYQSMKGSWLSTLPLMNDSVQAYADHLYRQRVRVLQRVDEIIEDVVALLEEKGVMDNTYVIYTRDNGYHVGNHRMSAGKARFYAEDSNLPFFVRGPGIPAGVASKIPGAHVDLVPTFLEIAGVAKELWPQQLDSQSLLEQWHNPEVSTGDGAGGSNTKETINVEFWGLCIVEAPSGVGLTWECVASQSDHT